MVLLILESVITLVYCTRKVKQAVINKHNITKLCSMKHYSKERLLEDLGNIDWSVISNCIDVCEAWSWFKTMFVNIIDTFAFHKDIRVKQRT